MPAKGQYTPLIVRFWRYAIKGKPAECWWWHGSKDVDGYGHILVRDNSERGHRSWPAHRVAHKLFVGPVPKNKFVLHNCDNPSCVNPKHLRIGTHQDNMDDRRKRGRTKGEKNYNAKLTDAEVRAIRRDTRYQYVIAKDYGVIQATISKIKLGKTWTHIK